MQTITKPQWRVGIDVVVIDATSDRFGQVGAVVRITSRSGTTRCSVNFDGAVFGFDQTDLQIALL